MVTKFINNLKPIYQRQMRYSNIQNFKQLTKVGTQIKDDLRSGTLSTYIGELPKLIGSSELFD